jgi:hypothetical protein
MKDIILTLPLTFTLWFGKAAVIGRAPKRTLYVYSPVGFAELEQRIDENSKKYGLTYPTFREFMRAGLFETDISVSGEFPLPDALFHYLGEKGEIEIRSGRFGIEIQRIYPEICHCDDSTCGKCLLANCRDEQCLTHTLERKNRVRKRAS